MWTSAIILALLCLRGGWATQLLCHGDIEGTAIKQLQINYLVGKINKPIDIGFQSTEGILEYKDFKYLGLLPGNQPFSLFDEKYHKEAKHVLKLLLKAKDFEHFLETAEVLLERVNEDLLYYCLSVAVLRRNDTQGLRVPPVQTVYPDKFFKIDIIKKMKKMADVAHKISPNMGQMFDASKTSINYINKNDLNYFLEDIGMNSGHYQWHVLNPAIWWKPEDYDRKGERFYWMHKQMVNRYDAERVSNGMGPVKPFINWEEEILDGFAPELRIDKQEYRYAYRPRRLVLKDLDYLTKSRMMMWEQSLTKAILGGMALTNNDTLVDLNNEHGIDVLGELVESSATSVNRNLYGNLHSAIHVMTAKITDPNGIHDATYGAMYDVATSARDPLFYAWHKYINRIFELHKDQLPPYTKEELEFKGVKVTNFTINGSEKNVIRTGWEVDLFPVSKGFTFTKKSIMGIKVKHLQHEDFTYTIEYENSGPVKQGIVRIYAVPYIEVYRKMSFNQLRKTIIELDLFVTTIQSGKNTIQWSSKASNIVQSKDSIFRTTINIKGRPWPHCYCSWPDYLLLPKGKKEGMPMAMVVTINDWEEEKVNQERGCRCSKAASYCDIDRKMPFKRALGFPFDRRAVATSFTEFKTSNMGRAFVKLQFTGETHYSY